MNLLIRRSDFATFACAMLFSLASGQVVTAQQDKGKPKAELKPAPDLVDVSYGPHERNVMDVWKAKSAGPAPLLVFIHGGGFRGGSKDAVQPYLLNGCLANGVSVVAISRTGAVISNPGPDVIFVPGDRVAVIGEPDQLALAEVVFHAPEKS